MNSYLNIPDTCGSVGTKYYWESQETQIKARNYTEFQLNWCVYKLINDPLGQDIDICENTVMVAVTGYYQV